MVTTTTGTAPSPSPAPYPSWPVSPSPVIAAAAGVLQQSSAPSKLPVDFSPPLIAMVVVVTAAFLLVSYPRLISRHLLPPVLRIHRRIRRWHRRRRRRLRHLPSSVGDIDSPPFPFDSSFHSLSSPYGLDESVIKTIPLSLYSPSSSKHVKNKCRECAVCLLEFEDGDYVRTLPVCSHSFHVDCIDIWLRSHANCPLCRAGIFGSGSSPFIPLMAARIRPSLDESILQSMAIDTVNEAPQSHIPFNPTSTVTEITPCLDEPSPRRTVNANSEERFGGQGFLLKRSYSFGFERSLASERMVMEPATASPWRYRRGGGFWSKRPSPFGSLNKTRVFSFRHYRGMKSPFFRRRGGGGMFFPLSETNVRFSGGGGSSRRSKSMTSPMFFKPATAAFGVGIFSSSRLRCGDPEALLSPERYHRR